MTEFSTLWGRLLTQELGTDDSTQLFTDARRQAGINDGLREFAELTECCVRTATITLTGGTQEYDLNSTYISGLDFVRLAAKQSVEVSYTDASSKTQIVTGDDLRQRDVAWLNRYQPGWRDTSTAASSGGQLPSAFYLRPDASHLYLGFVPVPSTGSSASMTATVPYVPYVAALSASTDVPYRFTGFSRDDLRPFHMAAVHYAAHQLEKLRRDDQASDRQLQKFLGYVTRYLQGLRQKGGTSLTFARTYFRRSLGAGDQGSDPRT
jgi:hypothetical protein